MCGWQRDLGPTTLRRPTPGSPACRTHAGSPARGAPSGRGHTLGTGAHRPLASNDTVHSGGGTQSPWRLVHRRTGGSPRSPRSRSVLPAGTGVVTALPSPQDPASSPPSTVSFCPGNPGPPSALRPHPCSPRPTSSPKTSPSYTRLAPPRQPYLTAVAARSCHTCLAQAVPAMGVTGLSPTRGAVAPCRRRAVIAALPAPSFLLPLHLLPPWEPRDLTLYPPPPPLLQATPDGQALAPITQLLLTSHSALLPCSPGSARPGRSLTGGLSRGQAPSCPGSYGGGLAGSTLFLLGPAGDTACSQGTPSIAPTHIGPLLPWRLRVQLPGSRALP